jgi:DNA (cytosine-5)-methyltransferase 1
MTNNSKNESPAYNVLDLFSGIGGFSLGLENAGMKTAAFCEIDGFCQSGA